MQKNRSAPKVSVGLPVYNGECYVAEAIESILSQTYENLELIISDNGSIDRTEEICRHYAALDPRVRYFRQPLNLGAAANFNRVFELADGSKYFKWAAHDDWIGPTFLEKCVRALESNPDAVLCQSLVEIMNEDGQPQGTYDHTASGAGLPRPSDRFRARLTGRRCIEVFGVIRSSVLASTSLIASHVGADKTLLLELALCGRFVLVPQCLFFNRNHAERFSRQRYTSREKVAWYAADLNGAAGRPMWTRYAGCLRIIRARVGSRAERLRCYGHLLRSLGARQRWILLMLEPLVTSHPRLYSAARKLRRLAGGEWVRSRTNASAGGTTQVK